jgi:hypothetical protein
MPRAAYLSSRVQGVVAMMTLAALLSVPLHAGVHVGEGHANGDCASCHIGKHTPIVAAPEVALSLPAPGGLSVHLTSTQAPPRLIVGAARTRAPPVSC